MLPLKSLQRAFAARLLRNDVSILQGLIDGNDIPSDRRMNVYLNNYQASLQDALANTYPVVLRLVGAEFFQFLVARYSQQYPARSGDLREFGRDLANYLVKFEPAAVVPYLVDVARLEWAYHEVVHAPSPTPFDYESLAKIDPQTLPALRLRLGSASRLVHSQYPIFRIWEVNQKNYTGDDHTDLNEGAQTALVVQRKTDVEVWLPNAAETIFLQSLSDGKSLGHAVEASLECMDAFDLKMVLEKYLQSGALIFSNLGITARDITSVQANSVASVASSYADRNQ